MVESDPQDKVKEWASLKEDAKEDYEQAQRELKEIELTMEHSQQEVGKLTQRNASMTAHLLHVQGQFDAVPRDDIRQAYDNALDAQQRFFVMRGQLDKLQSDHAHLERYTTPRRF